VARLVHDGPLAGAGDRGRGCKPGAERVAGVSSVVVCSRGVCLELHYRALPGSTHSLRRGRTLSHRHEASLVLRQRYIRIRDSRCLEMIFAKGASGARDPDEEFGRLSAVVVLAEDRLNPEPDNMNMLLVGHVRLQAVP
jgi:hypothetical protein